MGLKKDMEHLDGQMDQFMKEIEKVIKNTEKECGLEAMEVFMKVNL